VSEGILMSQIEPSTPLSDADLDRLETQLGRSLPEDYRKFMREYGGAFVGGSIDGGEELSVLRFFGLQADGTAAAASGFFTEFIEVGMLPVANCILGGIYVLKPDNSIWFRLVYSGKLVLRQVAGSFGEFRDRIVVRDDE